MSFVAIRSSRTLTYLHMEGSDRRDAELGMKSTSLNLTMNSE
jgi:hypothetical protein